MAVQQVPQTTPEPDGGERAGRAARRRTAVIGTAVVAGSVLAATAPFVLAGGHARPERATGAVPPPPLRAPRTLVTGDVDGDGTPDTVTMIRHGLLRVARGSVTVAQRRLSGDAAVVGVADIGPAGLAVVTSAKEIGGTRGRDWLVWQARDGVLRRVPVRDRAVIGSEPGFSTAWIAGGTLYDGVLDPLQQGQDHVVVSARSWSLSGASLTSTSAGVRCWDRSSDVPPLSCRAGQDWAYDAGPHGDLPALLPASDGQRAGPDGVTFDNGDSWSLRRATPPGSADAPRLDLVFTAGARPGPSPCRPVGGRRCSGRPCASATVCSACC